MSQIIDKLLRSDISCRGYTRGVSAEKAPCSPKVIRQQKIALGALAVAVGVLAIVFFGMLFGLW